MSRVKMTREIYIKTLLGVIGLDGNNYYSLASLIDKLDFIAVVPMDENRVYECLEIRNELGYISKKNVSCFEMLVNLSVLFSEKMSVYYDLYTPLDAFFEFMGNLRIPILDNYELASSHGFREDVSYKINFWRKRAGFDFGDGDIFNLYGEFGVFSGPKTLEGGPKKIKNGPGLRKNMEIWYKMNYYIIEKFEK